MRGASTVVAFAVLAISRGGAQTAPVVWATDSTAQCVGITLPISGDVVKMQELVGQRWRVVPSKDGSASASLFITTCPRSTISGKRIGPATLAAVILAVEARADKAGGARSPVVPVVFGDSRSPAAELFSTHAFAVRAATVTLGVDSAGKERRVTFAIATPDGRIEGSAIPADSSAVRSVDSRLFGTDAAHPSEFSGPEWMRRSSASATVRATGTTLFSELGVVTMPTRGLYDAAFGWRFAFAPTN